MTKLKIYKIASLKKMSVAKLLMLALIKTAVKNLPELTMKDVRNKRNALHKLI